MDLDKPEDYKLFQYYVDGCLRQAAGHTNFCPAICQSTPISEAKTRDKIDPGKKVFPPGIEAFTVLAFENNVEKWPKSVEWYDNPENNGKDFPKYCPTKSKTDFLWVCGRYTNPNSGQCKLGGWKKEGRDRYKAIKERIQTARKDKNYLEVEKDFVKRWQKQIAEEEEAAGRKPRKKKRKRDPDVGDCGGVSKEERDAFWDE